MDANPGVEGPLRGGSVYASMAEHRRERFADGDVRDLCPGAWSDDVPADVVTGRWVLRALERSSDREAVEAPTADLRWEAVCRFAGGGGVSATVSTSRRPRLVAASARPQRIFDTVRQVAAAIGP